MQSLTRTTHTSDRLGNMNATMQRPSRLDLRRLFPWILKVNMTILLVDMILVLVLSQFLNYSIYSMIKGNFLTLTLLLESGITFLVGGAIAMSSSIFMNRLREHVFHSSEEWTVGKEREAEKRASRYIVLGILLFLESIAWSLLTY